MSAEFPLALVIKAVDKASGPLRAISDRFAKLTSARKSFGKSLGDADEALNLSGLGRGLAGFGGALRNVGAEVFNLGAKVIAIGAAAGFALFSIVRGAVDAGDQLAENALRVGMGVDAYASLRFAAEQADVPQEMFAASLDKLNKQMGDMKAGKGGEFLAFLNEVGPGLAKQMKGAKSTEQGLSFMTDALNRIQDPQRRATLAAHAFGKSNAQMGVFLGQGSAAIQAQQVRFLELQGSQEAFARTSGDLDNAMREVQTAFYGLGTTIGGELFPELTKLAGLVTEFLVKNREGLQKWAKGTAEAIKEWIAGGGFERLIAKLTDIATTIGKVVDYLGPMGVAMVAVGVLALPLIASLGSLGIAAVALAIEAVPLLVAAVSFLAPAFMAAGAAVAGFAVSLAPALLAVAPFLLMAAALVLLAKAIGDNWGALAFIFKDWGNSLKWAVLDAWAAVRPIYEKLAMIPGFGGLLRVGDWAAEGLTPLGTSTAAQAAPSPSGQNSSEARVSVDFSNLPQGARVSSDPTNSQSVDMSLGYSMGPT